MYQLFIFQVTKVTMFFILQFEPHFFLDQSDTPVYLIKYVDYPNTTFFEKIYN